MRSSTFTLSRSKMRRRGQYLLPLAVIVFLVIGIIFSASRRRPKRPRSAALARFVLGGRLWRADVGGARATAIRRRVQVSVMMLTIMAAAIGFSQLLAFSGGEPGLLNAS